MVSVEDPTSFYICYPECVVLCPDREGLQGVFWRWLSWFCAQIWKDFKECSGVDWGDSVLRSGRTSRSVLVLSRSGRTSRSVLALTEVILCSDLEGLQGWRWLRWFCAQIWKDFKECSGVDWADSVLRSGRTSRLALTELILCSDR